MFVLLKVQSLQLSFRPAGVSLGGGGGAKAPPGPPLRTPLSWEQAGPIPHHGPALSRTMVWKQKWPRAIVNYIFISSLNYYHLLAIIIMYTIIAWVAILSEGHTPGVQGPGRRAFSDGQGISKGIPVTTRHR